jgi:hypothetical protein
MAKYETRGCAGHWLDAPEHTFDVLIALNTWDGEEDAEDERIFYYMDGEPLAVGSVVSEGFLITHIEEKQ